MQMRMTAIIVGLAVAGWPALAQGKVQKPAAPAASRPAHRAPAKNPAAKKLPGALANTYAAMPEADRLAIQADLAWIGDYEGVPGGDFDEHTVDAIKAFQKRIGGKDSGILDDQERARLDAAARSPQEAAGWRLIDDPASGTRFGLPEKLVSANGASRTGSRWTSGHGQIQIETFRLREAGLPALFDQEKKTPRERRAEWSVLKADSFVITGTQGLKNFVVRAESSGVEVRGITILYDQATAGIMGPVAVAMANAFQGFPDPTAALPPGQDRAVEYGTAIAVDRAGDLVAIGPLTSGCDAIAVPGYGHAERIAEGPSNDLALLRLYGARSLEPAALGGESAQGNTLTLVGIADPMAQEGGDAVTKAAAQLNGQSAEPAPRPGFSGAAAIDAQGHFAGIVELKSTVAAGPGPAALQAILVPSDAVRGFLAAHGINPAGGQAPIEQSVVRIICVRK
jgi:peptidoglycan hydrolase-like protein with peptidoglycan-binding domain